MTKLEEKLIELGYEKTNYCFYFKKDIRIYITWDAHQILKDKCCVVIERRKIKNRNDIQKLHDSISNLCFGYTRGNGCYDFYVFED